MRWIKRNSNNEWIINNTNIYSTICNVSNNYFCIESEQSSLAGLSGTYRLYYNNEPVWFREWDYCDNTPGILIYDFQNGILYLFDPIDQ